MLDNTAQLLDLIPEDVEFTYNQKIDLLKPLLQNDSYIPYTTLLKHLHLPKAHFDETEPNRPMVCPSDCSQKQSCQRIREILALAHQVARKVGERNKVFEGLEVSLIGSTREGSRAFFNDEVDTHLSLNNDLKKLCFFGVEEQALKRRDP